MRTSLRILIKDARHHWPLIAGWWAVMAGFTWLGAPQGVSLVLAMMSLGMLVVWVIHEDELTGHRQYWITRPISGMSLLGAKLLFVLVFGNAAVLLSQAAAFAAIGVPPLSEIGVLLSRQIFLTALLVLPAAALAAVTRTGMQTVTVAIGALAAALFLQSRIPGLRFTPSGWGSAVWVAETLQAALAAGAAVAVLLLQYRRRTTSRARILMAAGLAVVLVAPRLVPWAAARTLVVRFSPAVGAQVAQLALDTARLGATGPDHSSREFWLRGEDRVEIWLPVAVRGVPEGMQAQGERSVVEFEAPGGERWNSGWINWNFVYDEAARPRLDGEVGAYWQYVAVDRRFFEKYKAVPVRAKLRVAFLLLDRARTAPLPLSSKPQTFPGGRVCELVSRSASLLVLCSAIFNQTAATSMRFQPEGAGDYLRWGIHRRLPGPYSTSASFSIWETSFNAYQSVPSEPSRVYLETRDAAGYFDRVLDLPQIRLAELL